MWVLVQRQRIMPPLFGACIGGVGGGAAPAFVQRGI